MSSKRINCPLIGMFKFLQSCPITDCLYHTIKCTPGCIILGTCVPDVSTYGSLSKQFSIAEILYYKGEKIPKATLRSLNSLKKGGALKLRGIVILYYYSEWVNQKFHDEIAKLNTSFSSRMLKSELLINFLKQYPFCVPDLNISLGTLFYLLQKKNLKAFKEVSKVTVDLELTDILEVSQPDLKKVRSTLKQLNK